LVYQEIFQHLQHSHTAKKRRGLKWLEGAGHDGALLQQMRHGRRMLRHRGPELDETRGVSVAVVSGVGFGAIDGAPTFNPAKMVDVPGMLATNRWELLP